MFAGKLRASLTRKAKSESVMASAASQSTKGGRSLSYRCCKPANHLAWSGAYGASPTRPFKLLQMVLVGKHVLPADPSLNVQTCTCMWSSWSQLATCCLGPALRAAMLLRLASDTWFHSRHQSPVKNHSRVPGVMTLSTM